VYLNHNKRTGIFQGLDLGRKGLRFRNLSLSPLDLLLRRFGSKYIKKKGTPRRLRPRVKVVDDVLGVKLHTPQVVEGPPNVFRLRESGREPLKSARLDSTRDEGLRYIAVHGNAQTRKSAGSS